MKVQLSAKKILSLAGLALSSLMFCCCVVSAGDSGRPASVKPKHELAPGFEQPSVAPAAAPSAAIAATDPLRASTPLPTVATQVTVVADAATVPQAANDRVITTDSGQFVIYTVPAGQGLPPMNDDEELVEVDVPVAQIISRTPAPWPPAGVYPQLPGFPVAPPGAVGFYGAPHPFLPSGPVLPFLPGPVAPGFYGAPHPFLPPGPVVPFPGAVPPPGFFPGPVAPFLPGPVPPAFPGPVVPPLFSLI